MAALINLLIEMFSLVARDFILLCKDFSILTLVLINDEFDLALLFFTIHKNKK